MDPFQPDPPPQSPPLQIHLVAATDSPEFALLRWALRHSPIVALDAEWKPYRTPRCDRQEPCDGGESAPTARIPVRSFPTVSLLQIACLVGLRPLDRVFGDSPVFLVDLLAVPLDAVWEMLRDMFGSPAVIKLGFKFKQDLIYLSSTFSSQGCDPGFDRVEPFIDITSIYHHLKGQNTGRKHPKDTKSLATICKELVNVSLLKEHQCSDWSRRPLSQDQILYAAADAYYLLKIFELFQQKFITEGFKYYRSHLPLIDRHFPLLVLASSKYQQNSPEENFSKEEENVKPESSTSSKLLSTGNCKESDMLDDCLSNIIRSYGEKIILKESDKRPRFSKRKEKKQSSINAKNKVKLTLDGEWEGPPPWDLFFGGDGSPKFLCDVMVEGLAKHLRCVGIDAAIPSSKKPDPRHLFEQAYKENRVLVTRDAKLFKYQYLARNQLYRVKSLLKNDQLVEVIETFQLKISEDQLMSRCTKCNGRFIQKPLTMEEAITASKGFQVIPDCLFDRNLEFWQCTDCKQLYWEGTQYHNAVQKFVAVCNLSN